MELAKKAARLIRDEAKYLNDERDAAGRAKFADASLSKGALDRMLDLAKGLLLVEDSKLDADPWLFNTATGTIDLRTGHLAKHDPRDLLTKMTPVDADSRAKCPVFMNFLNRITGGDADLMTYIQKCVGYSLTGITSEQVLFFIYGEGQQRKIDLPQLDPRHAGGLRLSHSHGNAGYKAIRQRHTGRPGSAQWRQDGDSDRSELQPGAR
jgi:putative DNA primase/helicase